MVRTQWLITVLIFPCELICYCFGLRISLTENDAHGHIVKALYNALDDGYKPTVALILEGYILINSSGQLAWSNPTYAHYDQQLVIALQKQLQSQNDFNDHHQAQDDQASLLPLYGGLKFLTYYCGPGNWSIDGGTVQIPYFSSIDQCCKQHDECPDTIVDRGDYHRYENLPYKPQLFTSLSCNCDVEFLRCLKNIGTFFSFAVAWIYTRVQYSCFDYEYPVMECAMKKNDGIFSSDRCLIYLVDNSFEKSWQWFDLPYLSSNQFYFPEIQYRYDWDWFNLIFMLNRKF